MCKACESKFGEFKRKELCSKAQLKYQSRNLNTKYECYKEYRTQDDKDKEVGSPILAITIIND